MNVVFFCPSKIIHRNYVVLPLKHVKFSWTVFRISPYRLRQWATVCSISTKVDLYVKQTYGGINLGGEAALHGKDPRDICSWSLSSPPRTYISLLRAAHERILMSTWRNFRWMPATRELPLSKAHRCHAAQNYFRKLPVLESNLKKSYGKFYNNKII